MLRELNETIDELGSELDRREPPGPSTLQNNGSLGNGRQVSEPARNSLRAPGQPRDYKSLFGNSGGSDWPDNQTSFLQAVFSGRHHPGLTNASMSETIPSDGGFLVPTEYASRIHNVALESELVMPRSFIQPMTSNDAHIPAMTIGDHSVAMMGGFTASYTAELGTISEKNPQTRSVNLVAKKLTGLVRFSNELIADIPGGEGQIINLCGKGLGWYRDKAFLKGTGAGQPLGILNAPCTIEVAKEAGQAAGTIMYENLTKMLARLFAGSFANSVWVASQSAIPPLLGLYQAVGVGGSAVPVLKESNGQFTLLTRPVLFTEKMETLGSRGDLMLADFSQYVCGLRSGMRFDTSIHVGFSTDELLARLIERHDGQPLWDTPLTLADGSTTVSPFVVLGARV